MKRSTYLNRAAVMPPAIDIAYLVEIFGADIAAAWIDGDISPPVTDADRQAAPPADPDRLNIAEATYPTKEK